MAAARPVPIRGVPDELEAAGLVTLTDKGTSRWPGRSCGDGVPVVQAEVPGGLGRSAGDAGDRHGAGRAVIVRQVQCGRGGGHGCGQDLRERPARAGVETEAISVPSWSA